MEPREYETMAHIETVHWWYRARRSLLVALVRDRCRAMGEAAPRLLDLGSGTGANASAYATCARVCGVEPSADAVRLALSRGGPPFVRGEGTALPFRDGSFEIVVASDVLEHIPDDAAAVREVARVLAPRGVLVFSVPAHQWLWGDHDRALAHQRRYGRRALRALLAGGGFRVRRLSSWNTLLFPAAAARRLAGRLAPARSPRSDVGPTGRAASAALERILRAEALLARTVGLPYGLSLVGWAELGGPPGAEPGGATRR